MSPVEELDELLQSLQALKPPGVTKSKIDLITSICNTNVQDESLLIQKIFTHFKKTSATHKLGVLYVVDSVTRQWVERARTSGQDVNTGTAADGTYAAGINRMTQLLRMFMQETLNVAPDNQKDKIRKLVEIWERGNTFPQSILAEFKTKIASQAQAPAASSTPPGEPSDQLLKSLGYKVGDDRAKLVAPPPSASVAAPSDASSILAALANMGKQSQELPKPIAAVPTLPLPAPTHDTQQYQAPRPGYAPPVAAPPAGQMSLQQLLGLQNTLPQTAPAAPQLPAQPATAAASDTAALKLQLLQALAQQQQQPPPELLAQIVAALGLTAQGGGAPANALLQSATPSNQPNAAGYGDVGRNNSGYDEYSRQRYMDHGQDRYRQRSRSPDYRRARASPPNRRDSPTYTAYDPSAGGTGGNRYVDADRHGRGRGQGGRSDYRRRSPPPDDHRRPGSPGLGRTSGPKWIERDPTLGSGAFKVLSRTLFVGGVAASDAEVRDIFSRFGNVQSCIVNHDKRHAFVKMYTRREAEAAREGMDREQDASIQSKVRSTRWGVGFGPRECSDYNTGVSVIPMDRLTDADRKWILSADYGGTGGIPLEAGMVVEEPDIEIGQGVSSKAISRRVGPDYTARGRGRGGFDHGRGGFDHGRGGYDQGRGGFDQGRGAFDNGPGRAPRGRQERDRDGNRPQSPRPEPNTVGVPPPVPGFGFSLPGI